MGKHPTSGLQTRQLLSYRPENSSKAGWGLGVLAMAEEISPLNQPAKNAGRMEFRRILATLSS